MQTTQSSIETWITTHEHRSNLVDIYVSHAKENFKPDDDIWNVLDWVISPGVGRYKHLNFSQIKNQDLKVLCKLWIIHARLNGSFTSVSAAMHRCVIFKELSDILGNRNYKTLKTADFYIAEKSLIKKYKNASNFASYLQQASNWLRTNLGLCIDYKNSIKVKIVHGLYGTEEGRTNKLIPNATIQDLLSSRNIENILPMDKFYLSVLTVLIGTGFRVSEMATLPVNCILKLNGYLHLRHYPKKRGKSVPRPIHPAISEAVEDAINFIKTFTDEARKLAEGLRLKIVPDWQKIIQDDECFIYQVSKWAHEWTSNPSNLLINPNGAWSKKHNIIINVIKEYEMTNKKISKAAANLGLNHKTFSTLLKAQYAAQLGKLPPRVKKRDKAKSCWNTDPRLISMTKLENHCGIKLNGKFRMKIRSIIVEAKVSQLKGLIYPRPKYDLILEERSRKRLKPLLKDIDGKVLLNQDEALLIINRYAFSEYRNTRIEDFSSITSNHIIRWLSGSKRKDYQDGVFHRMQIFDSRTNEIAKFTTHDIRHWLNTVYQNGGLTQDQIALIFNRKYQTQNTTYDQTSNEVRRNRIKQLIKNNIALGDVADNYLNYASFSREQAEDYLNSAARMVTPMPHGVCLLNLATTPCPHHLSCFSCHDEKPCEHLVIDPGNNATNTELTRISKETKTLTKALHSQDIHDSPMLDHLNRINRNIDLILVHIDTVNENPINNSAG